MVRDSVTLPNVVLKHLSSEFLIIVSSFRVCVESSAILIGRLARFVAQLLDGCLAGCVSGVGVCRQGVGRYVKLVRPKPLGLGRALLRAMVFCNCVCCRRSVRME